MEKQLLCQKLVICDYAKDIAFVYDSQDGVMSSVPTFEMTIQHYNQYISNIQSNEKLSISFHRLFHSVYLYNIYFKL